MVYCNINSICPSRTSARRTKSDTKTTRKQTNNKIKRQQRNDQITTTHNFKQKIHKTPHNNEHTTYLYNNNEDTTVMI